MAPSLPSGHDPANGKGWAIDPARYRTAVGIRISVALVSNPASAFNRCISPGGQRNYENGPELEFARAQFGSLEVMKRNKSLSREQLKGFQPLHFTWQP
jgi:hypothetical protein